ncbi:integrase, catalytic region, zinc finger, CCHC-type containing protein, partial [Tanacetum coccineum]
SDASPVKIEAPKELPKVRLVNESLKKLKFHLARFDNVVNLRTTPDAHTEEVLLTVMNSMSLIGESVNFDGKRKETCNLEAELLKSQNAFNNLLKSTICKLKDIIKSMREKSTEENVKYDYCDIETKNVFKEQFDSINKTHVHSKEQSDSLIDKLNLKSAENKDLKAQIQDKGIVEQAKEKQPLDKELDFTCKHAQRIQELLVYVRDTCPNAINLNEKKVAIKPKNKIKKVRFTKPLTSSSNSKQKSLFDDVHDKCLLDFVKTMNSRAKSTKKHKKQNIWKPTGHVFTEVGLKWKPTGRRFTIVGSSKKAKIVKSKNANHSKPNHTWGSTATDIPSSSSLVITDFLDCTVRFGNDHIARIMRYDDYQLENVTISSVYYVKGLGHNLFSVGQFYDGDLISLDDMLKTSPICLLSKASKTKSWLWNHRISHLNFDTINKLAKDGLARGIPRLKFQKDHLCSACELGKRKKSSHQPKAKDTNQEKLYLLHMDLCGPMRVASINGKKYILVIVDDYSRFTWVRFLRTKDEAPEAIIKCIKNIQDKKPDLSFFHVFGALCYPTNDNDDLGKLDAKADIGIFVGYAPAKKAFRIYNKRTQKIIETIHVSFDELIAMASEQFSSGPGLQCMTHATSSSGLVPNTVSQQPCIPPPRDDWGIACFNQFSMNTSLLHQLLLLQFKKLLLREL